jgi:hypothetical protein
MVLEKLRSN